MRPQPATNDIRLPVPPQGLGTLMSCLVDDDIGVDELVPVLERFPGIVAKLLTVANSAWSSPSRPIESLDAACVRLGFSLVRSISLATAVSSPFDLHRCPNFDSERFWSSAVLAADGAGWLAASVPSVDVPTARTAGLLHNLGLLWLAEYMPAETNAALDASIGGENEATNERLRHACGMGYDGAGALLAQSWGLPDSLVSVLEMHRLEDTPCSPSELVMTVACASRITSQLLQEQPVDDVVPEGLDIDDVKLADVCDRLVKTVEPVKALSAEL